MAASRSELEAVIQSFAERQPSTAKDENTLLIECKKVILDRYARSLSKLLPAII